jgi:hypothetical protein
MPNLEADGNTQSALMERERADFSLGHHGPRATPFRFARCARVVGGEVLVELERRRMWGMDPNARARWIEISTQGAFDTLCFNMEPSG